MSAHRVTLPTNAEWLARLRAGDEAAFEALFRAFAPGLCAFVSNYVGSREAAEEIVQDLFLALWRMRSSLEVESSLSTYLFSAARNRAFDWLKRERRTSKQGVDIAGAIDRLDPAVPTERELLDM